ncbi:MAG: 1,2-phenylacetyl-CoA epoxidase subunit PaaD [Actinomycetota bacterium]
MSTVAGPDLDRYRAAVSAVCDPELPPLTLVDLGILRSVEADADGTVVITVTPTYSGCPAVEYIEGEITRVLEAVGCDRFRVVRSFSPAWSTDWMTDEGRRKLLDLGIAPPGSGPIPITLGRRSEPPAVVCPRCGSTATEEISRFGSTACKSLYRCTACAEPFDHFKAI